MEVRGQLGGVISLFPTFESQGLNLGHQTWWQVPLPTKLSLYSLFSGFIYLLLKIYFHMCVGALGARRGCVRFLGAGVIGVCRLPCNGFWTLNLDFLEELLSAFNCYAISLTPFFFFSIF